MQNYKVFNIYCDESCHLKNDPNSNIMAIAGLLCPKEKLSEVRNDINRIKHKHGISSKTELKWTKISTAKKLVFLELAEYFCEETNLNILFLTTYNAGGKSLPERR